MTVKDKVKNSSTFFEKGVSKSLKPSFVPLKTFYDQFAFFESQ